MGEVLNISFSESHIQVDLCCLLPLQGLFTGTAPLTAGQKCIHPTTRPVLLVMTASLNPRYKHMLLNSCQSVKHIYVVSASSPVFLPRCFLFLIVLLEQWSSLHLPTGGGGESLLS